MDNLYYNLNKTILVEIRRNKIPIDSLFLFPYVSEGKLCVDYNNNHGYIIQTDDQQNYYISIAHKCKCCGSSNTRYATILVNICNECRKTSS